MESFIGDWWGWGLHPLKGCLYIGASQTKSSSVSWEVLSFGGRYCIVSLLLHLRLRRRGGLHHLFVRCQMGQSVSWWLARIDIIIFMSWGPLGLPMVVNNCANSFSWCRLSETMGPSISTCILQSRQFLVYVGCRRWSVNWWCPSQRWRIGSVKMTVPCLAGIDIQI